MSVKRTGVLGCGSYLPEKSLDNHTLSQMVDTSHEWIVQRTGIVRRHIAAQGETTADMAYRAAQRALKNAGLRPQDIDLVLVATTTPDLTFPAVAVQVQERLGMSNGAAFDIQAVCSGFLYALSTANAYLRAGLARHVLVIGADTLSRLLDWTDRTTCILFGDGAGAVVLGSTSLDRGLLACHIRSDGAYQDCLRTTGGVSTTQTVGHLTMQGREVFKQAVRLFPAITKQCFTSAGLSYDEIDWFIPHQANLRIIKASAEKIGLPLHKVVLTIQDHGNTSAASIPLALDTAVQDGRIQRGHLLYLEALGGGFTWAGALLRW